MAFPVPIFTKFSTLQQHEVDIYTGCPSCHMWLPSGRNNVMLVYWNMWEKIITN